MDAQSRAKNALKAMTFDHPDFIPMTFHINDACYHAYDQNALFDLMESHPFLFPNFKRPTLPYTPVYGCNARKDVPYKDDFSCVWHTSMDGITGTVTEHPLHSLDAYASYVFPDPNKSNGLEKCDWEKAKKDMKDRKSKGEIVFAGLRHGHTFLQLCDMRGYENLMFDMMDEEPLLDTIIEQLLSFNSALIDHMLECHVDMVAIPEDLGMQVGPMLSVEHFKKYIKPSYQAMMNKVRASNALLHMHSDGDIRLLLEDILEGGASVINLQDLVNGIDWIKTHLKGRVAIEIDLDRQNITPYGSVQEVDALVKQEIAALGDKAGGLSMIYGMYPGVPLQNAKAIMDAMEKYAFYYT